MADQTTADSSPHVTVYGRTGSSQAYAIRDFLHRCDIEFDWVEVNSDEVARPIGLSNSDDARLPVCIFPDGTRMENPTIRQIIEKLGWFHDPSRSEYDLAIYGAGPRPKIENYLGFPTGISGADRAERAREQAVRFGAEILLAREGVGGEFVAGKRVGHLADGTKIVARASICATGVDYRRLGLPNDEKFFGAGVYYGAGASEAMLCGSEHVFFVGGGNSAAQASLQFANVASKVTLVVREDSLKSTVSAYLIDRIYSHQRIEVLTNTVTPVEPWFKTLRAADRRIRLA